MLSHVLVTLFEQIAFRKRFTRRRPTKNGDDKQTFFQPFSASKHIHDYKNSEIVHAYTGFLLNFMLKIVYFIEWALKHLHKSRNVFFSAKFFFLRFQAFHFNLHHESKKAVQSQKCIVDIQIIRGRLIDEDVSMVKIIKTTSIYIECVKHRFT